MKRTDLLKSKEYWLIQIQNDLLGVMEGFMKKEKLNRTQLADKLKVTKGYISQIFNGDFDHKISKMVELSLASGKAPVLSFVDMNIYIKEDANDKIFELIPLVKPGMKMFLKENTQTTKSNNQDKKMTKRKVK